ncbi:uncharacterized protein ACA1_113630 [Acanthamoeba castellanii str. Neff]|uniref:Uncharacterized protein n=1 Tax=Acanthamoeba castellanii (strain ATCC 30010 / Neff) TaxID=1257118 RepID=L8H5L7_ACACF|nr:uncharacterized protein ACA1_113630 [Acanthamoeba castellanii str. Neff]ELR20018.1 hypothetical protein ACA1_113630 [Acanthamoeba castellanii str. Neff]
MDSPLNIKCKRVSPDDHPSRQVISNKEEAEDIEEFSGNSDNDNRDGHDNLADRDTILISELCPEEYTDAVSRLQAIGIAVVQDDLPYSMPMATMALDIPAHEVEEVALLLAVKWTVPGRVSIGCFLLTSNQIKLAVWVANKSNVAMVTADVLATHALCHGIEFDHCLVAVSMVVPGTWTLTLEDPDLANQLCSLYKVVLFSKELSISPWKESFRQAEHWAYVSGIAKTTSRRGVIEFFCLKCGEVTDHHFGKLPDGRMALWITIQFKMANGLTKALQFDKECKVDLKCQVGSETRQAARAAAQQACQQCQATKRASNAAAMAEYMQNALLLAQNFPRRT